MKRNRLKAMPKEITIPACEELWDPVRETFVSSDATKILIEHSLISVSKWEAKYCRPFLSEKGPQQPEEILDYIRFMTLTRNVDPTAYYRIDESTMKEILAYIEAPMTATRITRRNRVTNRRIITSEVIYYYMVELGIPFECERWPLNRLMTLIDVCNEKQGPKQKMSKSEIARQNRALNEARRKKTGTRG